MTPADLANLERLLAEYTNPRMDHLDRVHATVKLESALKAAAPDLIKCARDYESLRARVSDEDVLAWAKRHDLQGDCATDLRCMFDDARSFRPALSAGQTGGRDGE